MEANSWGSPKGSETHEVGNGFFSLRADQYIRFNRHRVTSYGTGTTVPAASAGQARPRGDPERVPSIGTMRRERRSPTQIPTLEFTEHGWEIRRVAVAVTWRARSTSRTRDLGLSVLGGG